MPARAEGRPALTRSSVVAAARAVLAEGGLGEVSMRTVARRLGVWPNALYEYVPSKEALLRAVLEDLLDGFDAPLPEGDWQQAVADSAREFWARMRPYPELAAFMLTHPGFARPVRGRNRDLLRRMLDQGVAPARAVAIQATMNTFMLGSISQRWSGAGAPDDNARPDGADAAHLAPGLAKVLAAEFAALTADRQFAFGLASLLAGFARGEGVAG